MHSAVANISHSMIVLLCALASLRAEASERRLSCEIKYPSLFVAPASYDSISGHPELIETDGKITAFKFESQIGHWPCSVDASADKKTHQWDTSQWRHAAAQTRVDLDSGYVIIDNSAGYRIRFHDLERVAYCSMDGVLVEEIVLRPGKKSCRVK